MGKRFQSVEEMIRAIREKVMPRGLETQVDKDAALNFAEALKSLEEKIDVSAGEIAKEVVDPFYKMLKGVGKVIRGLAYFYPGCTFAAPTIFRKSLVAERSSDAPFFGGAMLGFAVTSSATYLSAAETGYFKETVIAGVATNLISGAYEIVRHARNKVKERKAKGLEEKVEFTKPCESISESVILSYMQIGDFSFLAQDVEKEMQSKKSKDYMNEKQRERYNEKVQESMRKAGSSRFIEKFGREPLDVDEASNKLIELGLAKDENSARKVLSVLTGKDGRYASGNSVFFEPSYCFRLTYLEELKNPFGAAKYTIRKRVKWW